MPGVRVEAIGDVWAAFSPVSGETILLNDTSAAILEVLAEGAQDLAFVAEVLARQVALPRAEVSALLREHWPKLLQAGLVRPVGQASA